MKLLIILNLSFFFSLVESPLPKNPELFPRSFRAIVVNTGAAHPLLYFHTEKKKRCWRYMGGRSKSQGVWKSVVSLSPSRERCSCLLQPSFNLTSSGLNSAVNFQGPLFYRCFPFSFFGQRNCSPKAHPPESFIHWQLHYSFLSAESNLLSHASLIWPWRHLFLQSDCLHFFLTFSKSLLCWRKQ